MRVDLTDVVRTEVSVVEGEVHAMNRAGTAGRGRRDVMGVGGACGTKDLAIDGRVAGDGDVPRFEDERGSAFAHDEAVALDVEWPTCSGGGQRRHVAETAERSECGRCFGAASDHRIATSPRDETRRVTDCVSCSCTGCTNGLVGAL